MTSIVRKFFFTLLFLSLAAFCAHAEDDVEMKEAMKKYGFQNVTTQEGLNFRAPADIPIERKDGLVQPVSFDEYLYVKFKLIEERLTKMDKKIDDLEKTLGKLDSKLDGLKKQIAVQRSDTTPPQPPTDPQNPS